MAQPARLLLVRHGQSSWNASGRWQGQADAPLSDLGVEQATSAARSLPRIGGIHSSDLTRALHTARILAAACGVASVDLAPDLRERDVGAWAGLTSSEIDARWPGVREGGGRAEDAEPLSTFDERILRGVRRIAAAPSANPIVVVTHGGVMVALQRLAGAAPVVPGNLGGLWLDVTGDGHLAVSGPVDLRA